MKSKQLNPKSVRPLTTNSTPTGTNKQRVRCSLCDALLKASATHRYLLTGKSAHDQLDKDLTYGECCKRYLNAAYESDKLQMLCPACCQNLQRVYSLYKDAEDLTRKIQHTWHKTKRLNRARRGRFPLFRIHSNTPYFPLSTPVTDDAMPVAVKEELNTDDAPLLLETPLEQIPVTISKSVVANIPGGPLTNSRASKKKTYPLTVPHQPYDHPQHAIRATNGKLSTPKKSFPPSKKPTVQSHSSIKSHLPEHYPSSVLVQPARSILENEHKPHPSFIYGSTTNSRGTSPYAQLLVETPSPSSSSSSHHQQHIEVPRHNSSDSEQPPLMVNYEQSMDAEQSLSPPTNDDETSPMHGLKGGRLSRRQYDFLVKLPDQQSLNAFIETSAADSGSRWTWRRTSANSRGYKVYYVCNFSMRRHYHPCPAAMYALFHPEGSISIYSCGQHQHIPKDRLPVSITDATKDEIFKCLQAGMATTDIREHLTRQHLPFGDTRKLNNFIKYHKELLRFGTVTNVRIGGTAYRQPQCWAIRRQPSTPAPATATSTINDPPSTASPS